MGIFLTILKVLGLIILFTLALFLLLVLLVLFVPVRYKVLAKFNNDAKVSLKIRWLAGIIYYRNDYPDNNGRIRVFGIPVGRKKKKKQDRSQSETDVKLKTDKEEQSGQTIENKNETVTAKDENKKNNTPKIKRVKKAEKTANIKYNKKQSLIKKISDAIKMIRDEDNKKVISHVKTILFNLIKHIKPRNVKANMVIGLDDPASTGMLFGVLGIVRGFLKGKYEIYPDFEEKKVEGMIRAKGYIMFSVVLCYFFKLYNNQELKKILKKGRAR